MKLEFDEDRLIVIREKGDPRPKASNWNKDAESTLLYHVKNILNRDYGYNLVKVLMYKDGNMVDELQHYLRPAKKNKDNAKNIYIWNPYWHINGAEVEFNRDGKAVLQIVRNIYNPEEN